jgi:hypothetical protein
MDSAMHGFSKFHLVWSGPRLNDADPGEDFMSAGDSLVTDPVCVFWFLYAELLELAYDF